jgi:hypothetical protein
MQWTLENIKIALQSVILKAAGVDVIAFHYGGFDDVQRE